MQLYKFNNPGKICSASIVSCEFSLPCLISTEGTVLEDSLTISSNIDVLGNASVPSCSIQANRAPAKKMRVASIILRDLFMVRSLLAKMLSRRAKLGVSCGVEVPAGKGLATHPYRVLGPWRSGKEPRTRWAKRRQRIL